jgi:hypothetical protein
VFQFNFSYSPYDTKVEKLAIPYRSVLLAEDLEGKEYTTEYDAITLAYIMKVVPNVNFKTTTYDNKPYEAEIYSGSKLVGVVMPISTESSGHTPEQRYEKLEWPHPLEGAPRFAEKEQRDDQYAVNRYSETYDNTIYNILSDLKNITKTDRYPWSTVSLDRAKKIWKDFSRTGIVRDENGVYDLLDDLADIAARLAATNALLGHDTMNVATLAENSDVPYTSDMEDKLGDYLYDEKEQANYISDYGLPKIEKLIRRAYATSSAEEKLLLIDQMLNIVHQRSNLSNWFIRGGRKELDELAGNSAGPVFAEREKVDTFFSPTLHAVENLKQEKGVAQQLLSMIKNGQLK